jgi:hypothetical protein
LIAKENSNNPPEPDFLLIRLFAGAYDLDPGDGVKPEISPTTLSGKRVKRIRF